MEIMKHYKAFHNMNQKFALMEIIKYSACRETKVGR
jgi:hypothetical protein